MDKWKRRIATAWKVLTGKQCLLGDAKSNIVYVQASGPDGIVRGLNLEGAVTSSAPLDHALTAPAPPKSEPLG